MATCTPKPLDTSNVELPASLNALLEQVAENTQEVWSTQRIADGWSYGPKRDDANKTNPCLVPYDQLPESEKEYDRKTAWEALKAVMVLGYKIVDGEDNHPNGAGKHRQQAKVT